MRGLSRSQRLLSGLVLIVLLTGVASLIGVAQPQALASLWPATGPASPECGGYRPCHTGRPSLPPTAPPTPTAPPVASPSPSPSGPSVTPQLPQTGSPVNTVTAVGGLCVAAGLAMYLLARRRTRFQSRHRRA